MRIISGKARGTKLYTLQGLATRPTLDRVKEALFNIIQDNVQDKVVLDLFSGSGAIGLEAASRGAKQVILCDKSKIAIEVIKKNVAKTRLEEVVNIINKDYSDTLKLCKDKKFDLIYLDPPFDSDYIEKAIDSIKELNILNKNGIIVIETEEKQNIINKLDKKLDIYDVRKYGRIQLIFAH